MMINSDIRALEHAARSTPIWVEGYDGQTHYGDVLKSLAPATIILAAAVGLMLALL